jgi:acyl-CoA synthetase (AMP-forming)/AMP-acid ligase II
MAACTRTNTGYTETLVDVLHPSHAGRTAVVLPEAAQSLTYAQLAHEVSHARDALSAAGLGRGDVVAMVLPNCLEFVVCWLATTNGRSIAAPLNPDYRVHPPPRPQSFHLFFNSKIDYLNWKHNSKI